MAEAYLGVYAQRSRQGGQSLEARWGQLWNQLADLRNDVAHAGMRPNPTPAETLERGLADLWKKLKEALDPERTGPAGPPPGEG